MIKATDQKTVKIIKKVISWWLFIQVLHSNGWPLLLLPAKRHHSNHNIIHQSHYSASPECQHDAWDIKSHCQQYYSTVLFTLSQEKANCNPIANHT